MPSFKWLLVLLTVPWSAAWGLDQIEFLSGAKVSGKVTAIRKEVKEFDFELRIGGRTMVRTYPYAKVRSVTIDGKEYVLTSRADVTSAGTNAKERSEAEIIQLIEQAGKTPPDWYDSTPLDYPQSLDLSWPVKAPDAGWNNQVNVGQYIWDIVNPNPGRWRSGIRLVHHLAGLHQDDRSRRQRDAATLGSMYFNLLQDYPRAAYWLRQAALPPSDARQIMLAECYWRLGSDTLPNKVLSVGRLPLPAIKLLGDMGQTDRALRLAEAFARQNRPHEAYLLAGDACRQAGRYDQAIQYYQKVIDSPEARNQDYGDRYRGRAADSMEAIRLFDQANISKVANGTYRGTSIAYNGDLEVEVVVADGRIEQVEVIRHQEKQFYAALSDTTIQIVDKQSVRNIDGTSGATITSQAIVNATAKALAGGAR